MRRRTYANKSGDVSPAVVAQRLCDLLLAFPSAASSGVQWHTLTRKYEDIHSSRLDIKTLGHDSPIAAATALLWDVLRLVDAEDTDNPVVAVEDAVVLTPRPNALGTWPSLYRTLQNIVLSHGSSQKHADINGCEVSRGLLLSQLKPLLQIHWHTNFEEGQLGYRTDEGTWVRVKKMKHLVQAVLRWRDQRVAWQAAVGGRPTEVDEAITHRMDLVCSKRYNDLVLRCVHQDVKDKSPPGASRDLLASSRQEWTPQIRSPEAQRRCSEDRTAVDERALEELAQLRRENAQLRRDNSMLLQQSEPQLPLATPVKPGLLPQVPVIDFDDPFEPPPESSRSYPTGGMMNSVSYGASSASTASPSLSCRDLQSTPGTPHSNTSPYFAFSEHSSDYAWADSGHATPTTHSAAASAPTHSAAMSSWSNGSVWPPVPIGLQQQQFDRSTSAPQCALVPVWFPTSSFTNVMPSNLFGDRRVIPNGIVQQARAMFEPAAPPMNMNRF